MNGPTIAARHGQEFEPSLVKWVSWVGYLDVAIVSTCCSRSVLLVYTLGIGVLRPNDLRRLVFTFVGGSTREHETSRGPAAFAISRDVTHSFVITYCFTTTLSRRDCGENHVN